MVLGEDRRWWLAPGRALGMPRGTPWRGVPAPTHLWWLYFAFEPGSSRLFYTSALEEAVSSQIPFFSPGGLWCFPLQPRSCPGGTQSQQDPTSPCAAAPCKAHRPCCGSRACHGLEQPQLLALPFLCSLSLIRCLSERNPTVSCVPRSMGPSQRLLHGTMRMGLVPASPSTGISPFFTPFSCSGGAFAGSVAHRGSGVSPGNALFWGSIEEV